MCELFLPPGVTWICMEACIHHGIKIVIANFSLTISSNFSGDSVFTSHHLEFVSCNSEEKKKKNRNFF